MTADELKLFFERETGEPWEPARGVKWLMGRYEDLDIYHRVPRLDKTAHVTLSDKANWLSQQHCRICRQDAPISTIPIRIKPQSWQSLTAIDKSAFKAAISARLSGNPIGQLMKKPICLAILFVCALDRRVRDLDNMAKIAMDAVMAAVGGDDRFVDHLTLTRMVHRGSEEYMVLHLSDSKLNDHADVVHAELQHSWGGAAALELEDFRPGRSST